MTRNPNPGRVKTRLIPAIGEIGAADLHAQLLHRALTTVGEHSRISDVTVEVRYAGDSGVPFPYADRTGVAICRQQCGRDPGERLSSAIGCAMDEHSTSVVVIGTDCPDVSPNILDLAWRQLTQADVVFGPAVDGGYYLVGMKRPHRELILGIDWGTENVLAQSLTCCRRLGLSVALLPVLSDVDFPEDLVICRRVGVGVDECLPATTPGMLSVIIPTRNEVGNLEETIAPLLIEPDCEVIIADCGSTDGTCELARNLGCRVVDSTQGRGAQMNAGAALARGEVLLFLHADTRLPVGFREEIKTILSTRAIAGAFRFRIDDPGWLYRWIEFGTNLRSKFLQQPYGDQGLFLRAPDFFRVNGFRNWPLMEDFEISRRLKREGHIAMAKSAASTSARRWNRVGAVRNTLVNQVCITLYQCGISPAAVARFYSRWS